jgi:hypothetical protein
VERQFFCRPASHFLKWGVRLVCYSWNHNNFTFVDRMMALFQICASDVGLTDDQLVEPPVASENLIPGVLNAFAQVVEDRGGQLDGFDSAHLCW